MYTGSQPFSCPQSIVLFQLLFLLTLLFGSILSFPSLLMSLQPQIHRFLHFRVHRVLRKKILPIIHYSFVFQLKLQTIIYKAVSLLRPPIHSNYLQFFFFCTSPTHHAFNKVYLVAPLLQTIKYHHPRDYLIIVNIFSTLSFFLINLSSVNVLFILEC